MSIEERLAKTKRLEITADTKQLSLGDQKALVFLVEAAHKINTIYFDQVFSSNLDILRKLQNAADPLSQKLLRFFLIQGGPWDRWHNDEPFIDGIGERPAGGNFYPPDLKAGKLETYIENHPAEREKIEGACAVIRRDGRGFKTYPYHEVWEKELLSVARNLRRASEFCSDKPLKKFLTARADALLTDDYAESDGNWIDVIESPIEVTIGPYEVYDDGLFKRKAAYEMAIVVRDKALSDAAKYYTDVSAEFDSMLSKKYNYAPHGAKSPIVIGDYYFGAGSISHAGYHFMAYNLPNDEQIKTRFGSKIVFLKNIISAGFKNFTMPVVDRLMRPEISKKLSAEAFMLSILGHEIAHGVGPEIIIVNGRRLSIRKSLRALYSMIEEAKADTLGLVYLQFLAGKGLLGQKMTDSAMLTRIASIFRRLCSGLLGDHARAALIQYNWLKDKGVIFQNGSKRFEIDEDVARSAFENLADELMNIQRSGDYEKAKRFVNDWSHVPEELEEALSTLSDLPIGFEPIFTAVK